MEERKSGRDLDPIGTLLDSGACLVVYVDGAEDRLEEGDVVRYQGIENEDYAVAAVQRAADLVEECPELRLVVLIDPDCSAWIPDFSGRNHSDSESLFGQQPVAATLDESERG